MSMCNCNNHNSECHDYFVNNIAKSDKLWQEQVWEYSLRWNNDAKNMEQKHGTYFSAHPDLQWSLADYNIPPWSIPLQLTSSPEWNFVKRHLPFQQVMSQNTPPSTFCSCTAAWPSTKHFPCFNITNTPIPNSQTSWSNFTHYDQSLVAISPHANHCEAMPETH